MGMVIDCWRDLVGERALGFGAVGSIPWSAVRDWARWERLDRELTKMLWIVIQRLDNDRAERESADRALRNGGKG